MKQWYYYSADKRVGPITKDDICKLISEDIINENTYFWKEGFADWQQGKNIEELQALFISKLSETENVEIDSDDTNDNNLKGREVAMSGDNNTGNAILKLKNIILYILCKIQDLQKKLDESNLNNKKIPCTFKM